MNISNNKRIFYITIFVAIFYFDISKCLEQIYYLNKENINTILNKIDKRSSKNFSNQEKSLNINFNKYCMKDIRKINVLNRYDIEQSFMFIKGSIDALFILSNKIFETGFYYKKTNSELNIGSHKTIKYFGNEEEEIKPEVLYIICSKTLEQVNIVGPTKLININGPINLFGTGISAKKLKLKLLNNSKARLYGEKNKKINVEKLSLYIDQKSYFNGSDLMSKEATIYYKPTEEIKSNDLKISICTINEKENLETYEENLKTYIEKEIDFYKKIEEKKIPKYFNLNRYFKKFSDIKN